MKTIDRIIDDVLKAEGGFVDDPTDAGGATNYGISLRYAKGIGLDLDGDGDTDRDDIVLVTPETARKLYLHDFYYEPRLDKLPPELQPQMVDFAVNCGAPKAIEALQRTLNRRFGCDLIEDGRMGPSTRVAAERSCADFGWVRVNNDLVDARVLYYRAIVNTKPAQAKFLAGWTKRAEEFRVRAA